MLLIKRFCGCQYTQYYVCMYNRNASQYKCRKVIAETKPGVGKTECAHVVHLCCSLSVMLLSRNQDIMHELLELKTTGQVSQRLAEWVVIEQIAVGQKFANLVCMYRYSDGPCLASLRLVVSDEAMLRAVNLGRLEVVIYVVANYDGLQRRACFLDEHVVENCVAKLLQGCHGVHPTAGRFGVWVARPSDMDKT
jgi:hypothetical protein